MKFTVNEIAALLGASIIGDGGVEITDLSKIEEGKPGTITFLANPKYLPFIYTTKASAVIVHTDFVPEQPVESILLKVQDPYSAFTTLLETARAILNDKKGIEQPSFIDPTATVGNNVYIGAFAYIGQNAKIGNRVKIYPNAYIGDAVEIGDDSTIHPNVTVTYGCKVGKNCIVHAGTVIGADGFGFAPQADGSLKKIPQTGIVRLEDNVEIGAGTTIDRATLGETVIRKGAKIDNLVQIAHNVEVGENTVIAAQTGVSGSTKLGKNVMLGGQVGVVGHINLADGTKVGAQSGVSKTVSTPNLALRGSPAQDIKKQLRSEAVFRNLEEMARKISELEEKLKKFES